MKSLCELLWKSFSLLTLCLLFVLCCITRNSNIFKFQINPPINYYDFCNILVSEKLVTNAERPQAGKKVSFSVLVQNQRSCSSAPKAFKIRFLIGTLLLIFYVVNVSGAAPLKWLSSRDYCFHLMVAVMAAVIQSYWMISWGCSCMFSATWLVKGSSSMKVS